MRPKKNRQRGLTLVEMMLTLAISAMLLMVAMRVTYTASRCRGAVPPDSDCYLDIYKQRLERLLRSDISHAESFRVTKEDAFEMKLHRSLDAKNLSPSHESSTVSYKIVDIDDQLWLVREQTKDGDTWQEFVSGNIKSIVPVVEKLEKDQWQEMPEAFILLIEPDNDSDDDSQTLELNIDLNV